jgi:hypothetical protein
MKRFGIILLGVFMWGTLLIPSGAVAHTSHAGVHAQSPFDAPKVKKPLHCILKGHKHSALPFCPHTMRDRNTQTQFKSDCGDHPSGAQVQTSWSKMFFLLKPIAKVSPDIRNFSFESTQFLLSSTIPDPLEKPPQ